MDESGVYWKIATLFNGILLFLLNAHRLRLAKYEETMEETMKLVNANTRSIDGVRLEMNRDFPTKVDLEKQLTRIFTLLDKMNDNLEKLRLK